MPRRKDPQWVESATKKENLNAEGRGRIVTLGRNAPLWEIGLMTRKEAALLACLLVASLGHIACSSHGPITYGPGRQVASLHDGRVAESSGVAAGRLRPGVFWTHNDSGDKPILYAFNTQGESLGAWTVNGSTAKDWEDMAAVRIAGRPHLVIADTGDNAKNRTQCALYVVQEPDTLAEAGNRVARLTRTIAFTYEDGPHDCEAVAVDPRDLTIYLFPKTVLPRCRVFALPWSAWGKAKAGAPIVARLACKALAMPAVTGADMSPDGRRTALLTYWQILAFARRDGESWPDAYRRGARVSLTPRYKQLEAVCYGPDGRTLYLTSEGSPPPLVEIPAVEAKAKTTRAPSGKADKENR